MELKGWCINIVVNTHFLVISEPSGIESSSKILKGGEFIFVISEPSGIER